MFPRLTAEPERGTALFDAVTELSREPHWYVAGEVADTIDGRFAMLATVTALVLVRLEREAGETLSVALTERFIEVMKSEHREMGLGDPKLGRTVRKLVGGLSRRVDLWRGAVADGDWSPAAADSVFAGAPPGADALDHVAGRLRSLAARFDQVEVDALAEGRIE
jgi:cytochrome b pre-mRNA-processing protein 3